MLLLTKSRGSRLLFRRVNSLIFFQRLAPNSSVQQLLIQGYGLLGQNTQEELEEKLSMFETSLSLSSEERNRLLRIYPSLLNQEKKELEERIRHFREDWHCSNDQLKTIFMNEKEFQKFSLEDLKRMHSIYCSEWKITKEKLPNTLFNRYYWKKYKSTFLIEEDKDVVTFKKKIIAFYKNEFGKDSSLDQLKLKKILASKIFEKNSIKEIKEKLSYLSSSLLLSQEESYRLMYFIPVILNESLEELKKKVEFFKEELGCSKTEWKLLFLKRSVIVNCPLWELELIYKLMSEEYGLQSEGIIRLFSSASFTPFHLSEMLEHIEERKYLFSILYKNSKHMHSSLIKSPQLFWMKPEAIKRKLNLFAEGLGCHSLELIASVTCDSVILVPDQYILDICGQQLSLLTTVPLETRKSIDLFKGILAPMEDAKPWPEMKRLALDENKQMPEAKETPAHRIEPRKRDKEVHSAFVVDKAKTLSMMGKDDQRVSQQASDLACVLALANSCDEISNPYHRFLRETIEGSKLDVLRELGGYEKALEKMGKALRKGIKRKSGKVKDGGKGVGWLALWMFAAKEAEKIVLSHENAFRVLLPKTLSLYFTTILWKAMIISSSFLLRGEELDVFSARRSFIFLLDVDSNFKRVMKLARAAETLIKERDIEGGNTAIEAWENGIGEEMSLEEGREHYRNHPVMKLVTKVLLSSTMNVYENPTAQVESFVKRNLRLDKPEKTSE